MAQQRAGRCESSVAVVGGAQIVARVLIKFWYRVVLSQRVSVGCKVFASHYRYIKVSKLERARAVLGVKEVIGVKAVVWGRPPRRDEEPTCQLFGVAGCMR